jgi:hypothetical protein
MQQIKLNYERKPSLWLKQAVAVIAPMFCSAAYETFAEAVVSKSVAVAAQAIDRQRAGFTPHRRWREDDEREQQAMRDEFSFDLQAKRRTGTNDA